jgi:lysozyme family protein
LGYGETTKKSGALLIKKDAPAFDAAYYFDIETASGGYKLRKVWNITADYFLLEMYNTAGVVATSVAATILWVFF